MNKLVKPLIALGVAIVGSVAGWFIGSTNSLKYHQKEIEKEHQIIRNISNQIFLLEQEIAGDKSARSDEIAKLKIKLSKLISEREIHENRIAEHELEVKRTMKG